eukprot:snap_masked-scaffold_8-processed-gene-4.25-mRNA-1 protein AED:1.00 eAED:1.00 QI:0/0/0/0/1/1/4/0/180
MLTFLIPLTAKQLLFKFNLGDGKTIVENLLRDVNNNDSLLKYLEDDTDILAEFSAFVTGMIKEEDKLEVAEKRALFRLVKDPSEEEAKTPPGDSVVAELRKSKKKNSFADTSFIPVTSCSVETLFSKCKLIFSDKRNRMMPPTLNNLSFLKMNKDELMGRDIYAAVKRKTPGLDDKEEDE